MDDRRFDDLARGVGCMSRRRWMLRLLAAGLFGALPALRRLEGAAAACVRLGRRCERRQDRCCGGAKGRRRCRCRRGQRACNGRCIAATACCPGLERSCDGGCIPVGSCCGNAECNGGVCAGGVCQRAPFQGICTAEMDICTLGPTFNCGTAPGLCSCVVRPNGLSFCAQNSAGCFDCTSDAECESALSAPGAVCVRGGTCGCSPSGTTCWRPCPNPA
jgi:hypothetical protein